MKPSNLYQEVSFIQITDEYRIDNARTGLQIYGTFLMVVLFLLNLKCVFPNRGISMKKIVFALSLLTASLLAKPNYPFPQNEFSQSVTPPNYRSLDKMNEDIIAFYEGWKAEYQKETSGVKGGYIIATGGGTNAEEGALTVSEGHGYGMLISVLMAGYDKDAKKFFDGYFKVFRAYPSDIDSALMTWQIVGKLGEYESPKQASSATDGDFDIAYALILADRQWGSKGDINYLQEAKNVIAGMERKLIHPELKRILLGDWVAPGNKYSVATRSSDWAMSHFRLFEEVGGNAVWSELIDTSYSILFQVQNKKTGLIPDFVDSIPAAPAGPNLLETERDGHYSSNACRVPWRIAADYYHYGSKESKDALLPLLKWIDKKSKSDLSMMDNGYSLEGKADWPVDDWGTWGAYSAPMMVAATTDSSFQKLVNSGWKHNSVYYQKVGYYGNAIRLLSLLTVSGNWWNPSTK